MGMCKKLDIFSPFNVTWGKGSRAGFNPFSFTIQTITRTGESLKIKHRLEIKSDYVIQVLIVAVSTH